MADTTTTTGGGFPTISISLPTLDPTTTETEPTTTADPPTTTSPGTTPTTDTATATTTSEEPPTTTTSETPTTTSDQPSTTSSSSETTTSPTTTAPLTTSQTTLTSTNGASTVTVITVTEAPATSSEVDPTPSSDNSGGDSGFFDNTGAVAGVFTVVGLAAVGAVVLIFMLIRRRRREKRLDRDFDEAAVAPVPVFLDDDPHDSYGRYNAASSYNASSTLGAGYSDAATSHSHGTYAQHPMSPESYEMSGPAPGGVFDRNAAFAGIGVPGRGNPYQPYEDQQQQYAYHDAGSNPNYHEAPAGYHSGTETSYAQHQHQTPELGRTKSGRSLLDPAGPLSAGATTMESYASYYETPSSGGGTSREESVPPVPPMPNPYGKDVNADESGDEGPGGGRKVLKVANE